MRAAAADGLGALLAGCAVAYMVFVSIVVAHDDLLSRAQKWAQWLIVWLLPLIGAGVVHTVHYAQTAKPRPRDRHFVPEENGRLN
jgi:hypothetical protein